MKKFWKLVSRKDLIFGILLFAVVIGMGFLDANNKIEVTFQEDAVDVASKRYAMNIPYDMIKAVELTEAADPGTVIEGFDDKSIRTGEWENEAWGQYVVCAVPEISMIMVTLEDGRVFVFNKLDDETTKQLYETLLLRLENT